MTDRVTDRISSISNLRMSHFRHLIMMGTFLVKRSKFLHLKMSFLQSKRFSV